MLGKRNGQRLDPFAAVAAEDRERRKQAWEIVQYRARERARHGKRGPLEFIISLILDPGRCCRNDRADIP